MANRVMVSVSCAECSAVWEKRADTLKAWRGKCRSCAMRELANQPDQLEMRRRNGVAIMKRVGKLPHYPDRNYRRGPANNKWRGGITPENARIRHSPEMKQWRLAVFERDNYTCQICGERGGDKHADHIRPFALHPELRFVLDNGRTLCKPCHYAHGAKVNNGRLIKPASKVAA